MQELNFVGKYMSVRVGLLVYCDRAMCLLHPWRCRTPCLEPERTVNVPICDMELNISRQLLCRKTTLKWKARSNGFLRVLDRGYTPANGRRLKIRPLHPWTQSPRANDGVQPRSWRNQTNPHPLSRIPRPKQGPDVAEESS